MFVESDTELPPETELRLRFALPQVQETLEPTARVIWRRAATRTARSGLGLRFLELDGVAARCIDDYVYERAAAEPAEDADAAPISAG